MKPPRSRNATTPPTWIDPDRPVSVSAPAFFPIKQIRASLAQPDTVGPASAGKAPVVSLQERGDAAGLFPAKAGPTKSSRINSGTGFSRESASGHAARARVMPLASSWLKPVPPRSPRMNSGTGFSREAPVVSLQERGDAAGLFPAKAGPTDTAQSGSGALPVQFGEHFLRNH